MDAEDRENAQFDKLAESFFERYRRGEKPSLEEYAARHPELAEKIHEILPALILMEQAGADGGSSDDQATTAEGTKLDKLGEYRLLREIGRGGMGIVYEAMQEPLNRRVALKVLGQHALLDRSFLERFRREAEAAASLQHANIVPVYDVGQHEGVHFFAMQYIDGPSLDRVIYEIKGLRRTVERKKSGDSSPREFRDEQSAAARPASHVASGLLQGTLGRPSSQRHESKPENGEEESGRSATTGLQRGTGSTFGGTDEPGSPTTPKSGLSTEFSGSHRTYVEAVSRIGMQVANALAYAHASGVVHRDIKPSNLLLDERGTVWVTDFGLAKVDTNADLTRTGDLVGTLRYMAPERFKGWSDARSDVYSLGLTLYELLTLRAAFDETDRQRLVHQILEQEPPRLRKLDGRIPRDLETITLKAIAKEPSDRYQSADELADDLRRFIADRPIEARRTTVLERSWRWCRRNPALATASTAVALLTVTIAVVSSVSALRLRQERNVAIEARQLADERLVLADDARRSADLEASNARTEATKAEQINRFLQEMLASASPRNTPRSDVRVREVLDKAAEKIESELVDQPEVAAALKHTIGWSYYGLGEYELSERHLRAALALRRKTLDSHHPDLAASLHNLCRVLVEGRHPIGSDAYREGVGYLKEAVTIRRGALGTNHPLTIESLFYLSRLENVLGNTDASGRAMAEVGLALGADLRFDQLPATFAKLGQVWEAGQKDEAFQFIDDTTAPWRAKLGPGTLIADAYRMLGHERRRQKDYSAAEPLYRRAMAIYREHYPDGHPQLAGTLHNLASLLSATGDRDAAEPLYREALDMQRRLLPADHPELAVTLAAVGVFARHKGNLNEADDLYSQALAIRRIRFGNDDPIVATTLYSLAYVAVAKREYAMAEKRYREALAIRIKSFGRHHSGTAWIMYDLACLLHDKVGNFAEAESLYLEALTIWKEVFGDDHIQTARARNRLALMWANCLDEQFHRPSEAVGLAEQAVERLPQKAIFRKTLGYAYYRTGQLEACIRELETSHKLQGHGFTTNRYYLAMAFWKLGRKEEARRQYDRGEHWVRANAENDPYYGYLRDEARAVLQLDAEGARVGTAQASSTTQAPAAELPRHD